MDKAISDRECRRIQLDILEAVSRICKENNIRYSLAYGTLLGAVRHGGFIPWDDDIDICLLRSDYDRLMELLKEQTAYEWLSVMDSSDDSFYLPFSKAVDSRTVVKAGAISGERRIWIDIFPLDALPADEAERRGFTKRCVYYRSMAIAMATDFRNIRFDIKYVVKRILKVWALIRGKKRVVSEYENYIKRYNGQDTGYVGCMSGAYIERECFRREWFDSYTEMPFEDRYFRAISRYDEYLETLYGDYMKLPPEKERINHRIHAVFCENNDGGIA